MTDDDNGDQHEPADRQSQVAGRRASLAGQRTNGKAARYIGGAAFLLVFGVLAVALLAPEQLGALFGQRTSSAEEMQRTSRVDPGIMTDITIPSEDTPRVEAGIVVPGIEDLPAPEPEQRGPSEEELERLAQLEALIAQLQAQDEAGGISADELQAALEAQAEHLVAQTERQLEQQRRLHEQQLAALRREAASQAMTADDLTEQEARQRAEEERQRREAIRQEQIRSDALVFDESEPDQAMVSDPGSGTVRELTDNESFLVAAASSTVETARASRLGNPSRTIVQGTVLQATLETAITTDLPGMIRAVLSDDVRSYDGSTVLLPGGSRLIGTYSSDVSIAQGRALIAWTRAVTPSGTSIMLGSVGADSLGRSGQAGDVDTRFFERFGSAALISFIGAAPQLIADDNGGEGEVVEDLGDDFRDSTRSTVDEYLRIPPTISIAQGEEMIVFVNRDLEFPG